MFAQSCHGRNDIRGLPLTSIPNSPNDMISVLRDNYRMTRTQHDILEERLDELLAKHGYSDRAAAIKAGLHPEAIRNIRRGNMPLSTRLEALAKLLGTTSAYLLGSSNDAAPGGADTAKIGTFPAEKLDRELLKALTMALIDAIAPDLSDPEGMADRFLHFYDLAIKSQIESPRAEFTTMVKRLVVGQK